jgi:hypothetical protein
MEPECFSSAPVAVVLAPYWATVSTPPPDPTIFVILLQDNIGRLSPQDVKIASHSI